MAVQGVRRDFASLGRLDSKYNEKTAKRLARPRYPSSPSLIRRALGASKPYQKGTPAMDNIYLELDDASDDSLDAITAPATAYANLEN